MEWTAKVNGYRDRNVRGKAVSRFEDCQVCDSLIFRSSNSLDLALEIVGPLASIAGGIVHTKVKQEVLL